jgi:hypothetical protein
VLDAKNPHEAIRAAVQGALSEVGRTANSADLIAALERHLCAPENRWALAALGREAPRRAAIRQRPDLPPRPRVTRWFECPSCLWTAVAEYSRCCEHCGAKVEWMPPPVVT